MYMAINPWRLGNPDMSGIVGYLGSFVPESLAKSNELQSDAMIVHIPMQTARSG